MAEVYFNKAADRFSPISTVCVEHFKWDCFLFFFRYLMQCNSGLAESLLLNDREVIATGDDSKPKHCCSFRT